MGQKHALTPCFPCLLLFGPETPARLGSVHSLLLAEWGEGGEQLCSGPQASSTCQTPSPWVC